MEVNENRGRLGRKKLQGKIRKKKNHQKEKDITGSVKRANHNKGSMIVSDPPEPPIKATEVPFFIVILKSSMTLKFLDA